MKRTKLQAALTSITVVFALSSLAFAADVSGTWNGELHTREGGAFQVTLTLKAEGDKLRGTLGQGSSEDMAIENGKVNGDQISFTITRQAQGNPIKINYTGKVEGNNMKLTSQREGSQRTNEMALTRK